MKRLTDESIELLRKMVAVESLTFGEGAVADLICEALEGWGVTFRRYGNNIVAECGQGAAGPVVGPADGPAFAGASADGPAVAGASAAGPAVAGASADAAPAAVPAASSAYCSAAGAAHAAGAPAASAGSASPSAYCSAAAAVHAAGAPAASAGSASPSAGAPAAAAAMPVVVLDAHIDTVPAASSYTRDPFAAGNDPSVVYGLGSNDDGGSVVAMIAAFRYFMEHPLPFRLILALCCEEEKAGPHGAAWLYSPEGPLGSLGDALVIVGEPTGCRAATSERGLLVLDGHAAGVSGHAARGEGVNALYIALDDIAALRAHVFSRASEVMGAVHLSVTQISAGTAHNVIPDGCDFVVDVRPTDVYTNEELVAELQGLCRSTLTPRSLRNRASATPRASRLYEAVRALGLEEFSSPTTSDWIRIPYPAVKLGPGESSRSHKADEFILADEIRHAVSTYVALLSAL